MCRSLQSSDTLPLGELDSSRHLCKKGNAEADSNFPVEWHVTYNFGALVIFDGMMQLTYILMHDEN